MMQGPSESREDAKTERRVHATSGQARGPLRMGAADRAEPGIGPEGGSGPYLTVLCCSLDRTRRRDARRRAPRLTERETAPPASHD